VVFSRHLESGVRAIASFLESKGWVRMSNNRSDKVTQPPKTYHPLGEQLEKVSMEDSAARADLFGKLPQKHRGFLVLTKDTPDREIKRARALFNDPLNREGRAASVLLLDDKFYEGVNLMHVQHVHLFEPIPNSQSERQAIARAIRRCSHAGQPWPWEVQIHRYFHVGPGGATDPMTDHYLQLFNNRMRKRFDQIQEAYVTASIEHGWVQSIQTLPSDVAEQVRKRLSLLERIKLALQRAFQLGVPRLVSSTPTKGP
jgi:hypothetical protein